MRLSARNEYKPSIPTASMADIAFTCQLINMEHGGELIDADSPADAVWEAADVIYFALVAALQRGATLAEIEGMLDGRTRKVTRRPGNAKPNPAGVAGDES